MMYKSKKGVSIMIGYVLLISLAVVMGGIIYSWARTQIPQDEIGCDDGISLFIKKATCSSNVTHHSLNLTLTNNGRFSVGGFLLYGSNNSNVTVATFDLTGNISADESYISEKHLFWLKPGVKFAGGTNSLDPGKPVYVNFTIPRDSINIIESIEIIPMRWQEINGRERALSCGNSKVREIITCS